jgi:hypothetical protein
MPRRPIDLYLPYLDDVSALWSELGEDLKVGKLSEQSVADLSQRLKSTLDKVNGLQAQLGLAQAERDKMIAETEDFAVKFRSAVVASYGARSAEAHRVPKLTLSRAKPATPKTG